MRLTAAFLANRAEVVDGMNLYTLRLDGQHERVDVPLDVRLARA
jgi:hypothetical protein